MKIAISQPTYLPWIGYFDLIDQVDTFVVLDSVQFQKRSWQQRNRIKTPRGLEWLTVPVAVKGRFDQLIAEVEIQEADFWQRHLRSIESNYRRAAFFDLYYPELCSVLPAAAANLRLGVLNVELIRWFATRLGIDTRIVLASSLALPGKRTEHLANTCVALQAESYVSPLGAADYLLADLSIMAERKIAVSFQHFEHPEYRQLYPPFQAYASVLDLLMNEGQNSLATLRGGRRPSFLPHEVPAYVAAQAGEQ